MKRILSFILVLIRYVYWELGLIKIRKKKGYHNLPELKIDGRIVIIVPHVDDEWIGCSTLLTKQSDVCLLYMDMPGGDDDIIHKERESELREISAQYNAHLDILNDEKVKSLVHYLKLYNPSYIFLPFFVDWHNEHIQCMKILQQALYEYGKELNIAMYQVSLPIAAANMVTHIRPMSKQEWCLKWSTFSSVYKTQYMIPHKRFAMFEKVLTLYTECYAAEVFSVHSSTVWLKNIDNWILTDIEKDLAKKSLRNLFEIFDLVEKLSLNRKWEI